MNTYQKLIGKLSELPYSQTEQEALIISQEIHDLLFQRLREYLNPDARLLEYIAFVQKSSEVPKPEEIEGLPKQMNDIVNATLVSKAILAYPNFTAKENTPTKEDYLAYNKAMMLILLEILDCEKLDAEVRLEVGHQILKIYKLVSDIYGVLAKGLEPIVKIVERRLKEFGSNDKSGGLYYWPVGAVPFDKAMGDLKTEGFIEDIGLASEIFKDFQNLTGHTLKWRRFRRELIYFLLLLYGNRLHHKETIVEIANKLFDFRGKKSPRNQFTSEVIVVEKMIHDKWDPTGNYYLLKRILTSR